MLDALEAVAGRAVRERVRFEPDATHRRHRRQLAARGATAARAPRLGLKADPDFADIVRQYIADCEATPAGRAGAEGHGDQS